MWLKDYIVEILNVHAVNKYLSTNDNSVRTYSIAMKLIMYIPSEKLHSKAISRNILTKNLLYHKVFSASKCHHELQRNDQLFLGLSR